MRDQEVPREVFSRLSPVIFFGNATAALAGIAVHLITAAVLGPSGKGVLAVMQAVPTLTVAAGNCGVHLALAVLAARQSLSPKAALALGVVVPLCLGAVGSVVLLAILPLLGSTVFVNVPNPLRVLSVFATAPLMAVFVLVFTLPALGYVRQFFGIRVLQAVSYVALSAGLAALGALNVFSAFMAYVFSFIAFLVATAFLFKIWRYVSGDALVTLLRASPLALTSYLGSLAQHVTYRLDTLLVASLMPLSDLGFYAVATAIAELVWYVPDAISPLLIRVIAINPGRAGPASAFVARTALVVAALSAVLVGAGSSLVIHYALPQFTPTLGPLAVLLVGTVAGSPMRTSLADLIARGEAVSSMRVSAFGMLLAVISYPLGILTVGILGAAAATAFVYWVEAIVSLNLLRRRAGVRTRDLLIPTAEDFIAYTAAARAATRRRERR